MTKIKMIIGILLLCVFTFVLPTYANQTEDPYQRIVLTLLAPNIDAQIDKYYENKLTESPTFAPFLGGNKVEVKYFSSYIDVNVTVIPYVGPHLSVGKDTMKFRIDNFGRVEIVNYTHIEDYKLPPNWQNIIRSHL
jgi:hypothetical protein